MDDSFIQVFQQAPGVGLALTVLYFYRKDMREISQRYKEDSALNREALIDSTRTQESLKDIVKSNIRLVEKIAERERVRNRK